MLVVESAAELSGDARGRPVLFAASFVVVVCLAILGIESWQVLSARNGEIAERQIAATNLAKSLADHASNVLTQADLRITGTVERLEAEGLSTTNVSRIQRVFQKDVARLPQLQRLSVIDADGYWITTDLERPPDRSVPHADREYFVHHRTHDDAELHLGPPIKSRTTNQWIVTVSRRFNTFDGRFAGVVVASISLAFFNEYYRQFDIGRDGSILLMMSNGTLLDRLPYKEGVVGTSLADGPLFRNHIASKEVGTTWSHSRFDGVERLTAYRKLDLFPAYAIVSFSKEEMLRAWARESLVHAAAALSLVVGLALLGQKLVSQIARRHADQVLLLKSREQLQSLNLQLDDLARSDGLTGLANRREFDRVAYEEVRRLRRNGGSLALIMLDVDRFKAYNDRFGHPQGDACIRMVADQIRDSICRPGDLSARYGGEEFVILLPSTDAHGALAVAEQLRRSINRRAMPHPDGVQNIVTVSMGIGLLTAAEPDLSAETLLLRADGALYAAKQGGRDAVRLYTHGGTNGDDGKTLPVIAVAA